MISMAMVIMLAPVPAPDYCEPLPDEPSLPQLSKQGHPGDDHAEAGYHHIDIHAGLTNMDDN